MKFSRPNDVVGIGQLQGTNKPQTLDRHHHNLSVERIMETVNNKTRNLLTAGERLFRRLYKYEAH